MFKQNNLKHRTAAELRAHFKSRAKKRYRLELNRADLKEINRLIQDNGSIPVGRFSLRASYHLVKFNGVWLPVCYDNNLNCVRTALPKTVRKEWMNYDHVKELIKGLSDD